jgi:hypothetical protein
MALYVYDPSNIKPKKIVEGGGLSVLETDNAAIFSYTGVTYVPLNGYWSSSDYDGDIITVRSGSVVDVSTFVGTAGADNPPSDTTHIKAYVVRIIASWAASSSGSFAAARGPTFGTTPFATRALVANFLDDKQGIVGANSDGDFWLWVGGANTTALYIQIFGYFI